MPNYKPIGDAQLQYIGSMPNWLPKYLGDKSDWRYWAEKEEIENEIVEIEAELYDIKKRLFEKNNKIVAEKKDMQDEIVDIEADIYDIKKRLFEKNNKIALLYLNAPIPPEK